MFGSLSANVSTLGLRWCLFPHRITPRDGSNCSRIFVNLPAVSENVTSRCVPKDLLPPSSGCTVSRQLLVLTFRRPGIHNPIFVITAYKCNSHAFQISRWNDASSVVIGSGTHFDIVSSFCTDENRKERLQECKCNVIKVNSCVSRVHHSRVNEPLVRMSAICLEMLTYLFLVPGCTCLSCQTTKPDSHDISTGYMSHGRTPALYDHPDHLIINFINKHRRSLA